MKSSKIRPKVSLTFERIWRAPVITITRTSTYPKGRSVGFVFDQLSDGRLVIATVQHAFQPEDDPRAFTFGLLDGTTNLSVEEYLTPINPSDDVAFVIVSRPDRFRPIKFGRPRQECRFPHVVYTAKNNVGEGQPLILAQQSQTIKIHPLVIMAPPWREMIQGDKRSVEVIHESATDAIEHYAQLGWSRLRSATLFSRPGFSGSPIFDDQWRLYGMNVRGSKDWSTAENIGDTVAFYPTSTLERLWLELSK